MTGASAIQSTEDLEQRRAEVLSEITSLNADRDRAAAQPLRKDFAWVTKKIRDLQAEADELSAAIRGARILEREESDRGKIDDRQKAFERARYALADVAASACEIQEAAEHLAQLVAKLRSAEGAARRAAGEIGVTAVSFPSIVTEHELIQLLETIPTRHEVWPDRSISGRVQARAGKAFQLIRAAVGDEGEEPV